MAIEIKGNTYPVRAELQALGCRWNAAKKCWEAPEAVADEARSLVPSFRPPTGDRAQNTCKQCGQRINYGVYCGKCEYS